MKQCKFLCNAEVREKKSDQPIRTGHSHAILFVFIESRSKQVKSRKTMFQRHAHIVFELLRERFSQTIMFKKPKLMHYDAALKLKVINFAKGINNSSAARQ